MAVGTTRRPCVGVVSGVGVACAGIAADGEVQTVGNAARRAVLRNAVRICSVGLVGGVVSAVYPAVTLASRLGVGVAGTHLVDDLASRRATVGVGRCYETSVVAAVGNAGEVNGIFLPYHKVVNS